MSTQAERVADLINNLNLGTAKEKAGNFLVDQATRQGVAVDDAAGSAPTKAEFDALLDSLRTAGIIAT